ncbi:hypothetical protein BKA58DRAFT_222770 [Alternaria rosae]|uniref:uncharacterized protein n=1 Tax=Alternaria rosae TaxID=1187941 RepID=UPI001E8E4909|nr:uncharacterized protein BKA58DRAFT_222770 [Alternaria rosae]KAH6865520.1 hypothetical protein BKA58DRAFT_222770 [Alternaria rosae]
MEKSSTIQGKPNSEPTVALEEPALIFEFFETLPAELQASIIRYAWNNAVHASPRHLHADTKFCQVYSVVSASAASTLAASIPSPVHYRVSPSVNHDINLHLTSKFFDAECKFLAAPHLLHLPVSTSEGTKSKGTKAKESKPLLFIPDVDTLHINTKGEITHKDTVLHAFAALPKPLRDTVKHIDTDYTDAQDRRELCDQISRGGGPSSMVREMDAPRLETVTISVCSYILRDSRSLVLLISGKEGQRVEMKVVAVNIRKGMGFWGRMVG